MGGLLALAPLTASSAEEAPEAASWMAGWVARAHFTSAVSEREPVDQLERLPAAAERVYFFTDLRDMPGQTAIHRWEYEGEVMAELAFEIGGPRWRVWSSKRMEPQWSGRWRVRVVNPAGDLLAQGELDYVAASED